MSLTEPPRKIILINPPFQPLNLPSTGLSYIYSNTLKRGHSVSVSDLNYPFADFLLERAPELKKIWEMSSPTHLGQLIFSSLLFKEQNSKSLLSAIKVAELEFGVDFQLLLEEATNKIEDWIDSQNFDSAEVVGITLLNYQLLSGLYLIKKVREKRPFCKIVLGGFYCSKENSIALMQRIPEIDFCVYGEGENTFNELLEHLYEDKAWTNILGLVYRDTNGIPTSTEKRPLMTSPELNNLSFPNYDWIPRDCFERYSISIPIVSIRGCYWGKCTFCTDFRFNTITYARSPESVVSEMEHQVKKHNITNFYFSDLASNNTIERIDEISKRLTESPFDYHFQILFIPNNITLQMLKNLKSAGCQAIQYGIENLSNSLLRRMGKSVKSIDNIQAIKLTELAGIQAISNIIKFFPTESIEEIMENYDKILRFPELFNGFVLALPIQFKLRDGAAAINLLKKSKYEIIDRAINKHFWSSDWSESIPDIEWMIEVQITDRVMHEHLWKEIAKIIQDNTEHRLKTTYEDDGKILLLRKYNYKSKNYITYELEGTAREVYINMESKIKIEELYSKTDVDSAELYETISYLEEENLIYQENGEVIATIASNVSKIHLDSLITTVESKI